MAILELLLLVIRAVQFLFAIIVLGLTGHGESTFHSTHCAQNSLTASSRLIWCHPIPRLLHDLRRSLDHDRRPLRRSNTQIHALTRPRFRHPRTRRPHNALLVRCLHRPRRLPPRLGEYGHRFYRRVLLWDYKSDLLDHRNIL